MPKKSKRLRVVIDTNLWISFLISHRLSKLDSLLLSDNLRVLFSSELLNEIQVTITKPKLKKHFSLNALEEMLVSLEPYIEILTFKALQTFVGIPKKIFCWLLRKTGELITY